MIFSGIQPTGILTLGNYLGALKNFKDFEGEDNLFCIVDLHAITSKITAEELKKNIDFLAAVMIAMDLHKKGSIFLQSTVSAHSELAWILQSKTPLGELMRMTQFKNKGKGKDSAITGLLTYPTLMAADILLYDTDEVPVGQDQKQHLELTRNLAERFNKLYDKELFVLPQPKINKISSKVHSLTDPTKKMSKSDENSKSFISLLDDESTILKKIKSSVTDSIGKINLDSENQPGVFNLLQIYASLKNLSLEESQNYFKNENYGFLKQAVAEVIIEEFIPLQKKIKNILKDKELINSVLKQGFEKAEKKATLKLNTVKKEMGINYTFKEECID